jgi:DNA-binding MarR family transcriptional regulator
MKRDEPFLREALGPDLGLEARSHTNDHAALKLWLRLLSCTKQVETELRRRLRTQFHITLGQFDYMAQLYRCPEGLTMGDLTRRLMVTGGSVTGTTDDLEAAGVVVRESAPSDRRTWIVKLTDHGKRTFEVMAVEHEKWILELIGAVGEKPIHTLHAELGVLRMHLSTRNK